MVSSPAFALTQVFRIICNFISCDNTYPSPVSLLPKGFRASGSRSFGSTGSEGFETDNGLEGQEMPPPLVHTNLGSFEGYFMTVVSGRQIYAFEGIQFALPPVGENRFREPQPITSKWNGTISAKSPGPICIQLLKGQTKGEESCLTLNIYTPQIPHGTTQPNLEVYIFIHGGSFLFGSGSNYGPAYILEDDIILVTINYRLGILGSFSTDDTGGNWNLKDQAMAINWVYDNIKAFGGNPKNITLSGQSAGAVSVHLQMMSSWAKDKISNAISFSGGAYNFWGINTFEQSKAITIKNAIVNLCPVTQGSQAMIDCMRKRPADLIVANQLFTFTSGFPSPSIEPNVPGAFLTKTPDEAYVNGDVAKIPWITTVTSQEANYIIAELDARNALPLLRKLYNVEAPVLLGIRGKFSPRKESEIVCKIQDFYGVQQGNSLNIPRDFFTQVGNARFFTVAMHKAVQMHSQIAPTYAGVFSYPNSYILHPAQLGLNPREYGVTHTDDLIFFLNSTTSPPIGRHDYNFAFTKLFVNIFRNFGKTGQPLFTETDGKTYKFWNENRDPEDIKVLQIDEEVKMISDPYKKIARFWESLKIPDTMPYLKL